MCPGLHSTHPPSPTPQRPVLAFFRALFVVVLFVVDRQVRWRWDGEVVTQYSTTAAISTSKFSKGSSVRLCIGVGTS